MVLGGELSAEGPPVVVVVVDAVVAVQLQVADDPPVTVRRVRQLSGEVDRSWRTHGRAGRVGEGKEREVGVEACSYALRDLHNYRSFFCCC